MPKVTFRVGDIVFASGSDPMTSHKYQVVKVYENESVDLVGVSDGYTYSKISPTILELCKKKIVRNLPEWF